MKQEVPAITERGAAGATVPSSQQEEKPSTQRHPVTVQVR